MLSYSSRWWEESSQRRFRVVEDNVEVEVGGVVRFQPHSFAPPRWRSLRAWSRGRRKDAEMSSQNVWVNLCLNSLFFNILRSKGNVSYRLQLLI